MQGRDLSRPRSSWAAERLPYIVRRVVLGNHLILYTVDEKNATVYVVGLRHGAQLPRPRDLGVCALPGLHSIQMGLRPQDQGVGADGGGRHEAGVQLAFAWFFHFAAGSDCRGFAFFTEEIDAPVGE